MDPSQHRNILATAHIIFGVFGLIALLLFRLFFGFISPLISEALTNSEPLAEFFINFGFQVLRFIGYYMLFGLILPSLIGAIGFLQNQTWGIYLLMISGALRLINFPLGTILGVYTLWVFFGHKNQDRQ